MATAAGGTVHQAAITYPLIDTTTTPQGPCATAAGSVTSVSTTGASFFYSSTDLEAVQQTLRDVVVQQASKTTPDVKRCAALARR